MAQPNSFHQAVAQKLIEQLEKGVAPWQKTWEPGQPGMLIPRNPTTVKRYRGINAMHLLSQGRSDQRWMTYRQAAALGAQVRQGEKGTAIQYWKFTENQASTEADGDSARDAQGARSEQPLRLERPRVFFSSVFNAEQIDGLAPLPPAPLQQWATVERAESILQASGAVIEHRQQNQAFYRPATDRIHLPEKSQFGRAEHYYAAALHELGHWTGHPSRLGRDLAHPFGSEQYAREELRAEIASMLVGDALGIGHEPGQHSAYVGAWIKVLQSDPVEIFRAAADAEKIQDYVLEFDRVLTLTPQQDLEINMQAPHQPPVHELWLLKQIIYGTWRDALETADLEQVDRSLQVLEQMQPLNTDNPFWARHPLPYDLEPLASEMEAVAAYLREELRPDAALASTLRDLAAGQSTLDDLQAAANEALGFSLPAHWTGEVRLIVTSTLDEQVHAGNMLHAASVSYQLYASQSSAAAADEDTLIYLTTTDSLAQAHSLMDRLLVIDANSQGDALDKGLRLARLQEARVQRDPMSQSQDLSSVKEKRQSLEVQALIAATQDMPGSIERQDAAPVLLIDVPFVQKNAAKALGARWDRGQKSWYVPHGIDPRPFQSWTTALTRKTADEAITPSARRYLSVPYAERMAAKAAGALWDRVAKSWYVGPQGDKDRLARWTLETGAAQQMPAMTPREEFAQALLAIGCVVTGAHPILDGQKHRITVVGEKPSEQAGSGFYVGHLDGHPAGYMKNNKTGIAMKWKSKGYVLAPEWRAQLALEAANKRSLREAELVQAQQASAQRVRHQMADLLPARLPTPYMQAKGIAPQPGVFTDQSGLKTYIPAVDADGQQWSMQYIQEDGTKRFAKQSRKAGCFHVVGGFEALGRAPALVIAEGYATAASLAQSLGFAAVAAFDSGNLPVVAKALHEKFPDLPVVIAGDDDRHLELTQGVNPGKTKAKEAADSTQGRVILPVFAPGENSYPSDLPPVTPEQFRQHLRTGSTLDASQLAALERMKRATDFNDLANQSVLGRDAVDRQVRSAVGEELDKHQALSHQLPPKQTVGLSRVRYSTKAG